MVGLVCELSSPLPPPCLQSSSQKLKEPLKAESLLHTLTHTHSGLNTPACLRAWPQLFRPASSSLIRPHPASDQSHPASPYLSLKPTHPIFVIVMFCSRQLQIQQLLFSMLLSENKGHDQDATCLSRTGRHLGLAIVELVSEKLTV